MSKLRSIEYWLQKPRASQRCAAGNLACQGRSSTEATPVPDRFCFLLPAVLLMVTSAVLAELPAARLTEIFPPGGQTGSTVNLTVAGADLDGATALLLSHPALFAKPKIDEKGGAVPNQFIIAIPPDAALGTCDLRIVGRFGVTNPRAFVVDALPERIIAQPNTTPSTAVEIQVNGIANARCTASAVDHYRFTAKKGQRILIDAEAAEIDSRAELSMALYDVSGRELERSRRGGLIDFTAAADGQYLLKIHDALYRGGAEYAYRLALRTGPRIDSVFPPMTLSSGKSRVTLLGRNLAGGTAAPFKSAEGKPLEQLEVEVDLAGPAGAAFSLTRSDDLFGSGFLYRLKSPAGISNPAFITPVPTSIVLEGEKNEQPTEAQRVIVPCEFAGRFYPRRDRDWVSFDAKKGEVLWIEVLAHRMGTPCDPFLLVQRVKKNEKGEESIADVQELYDTDSTLNTTELRVSNRDPVYRLEAKEDATYRLMVRDLFNVSSDDPTRVYRLSIRKESPDFRLAAVVPTPMPPKDSKQVTPWTLVLRRGGTIPLKVLAERRDGFAGPIDLEIKGLPKGIVATGNRIESGTSAATVMLSAAEDAAAWAGLLTITGTSLINNQPTARAAVPTTLLWAVNDPGSEPIRARPARDLALAVMDVESDPLAIAVGGDKVVEVAVNSKAKIPVKISRRGEFGPALKLKAAGSGAVAAMKEVDVDAKSAETAIEIDPATLKLAPGQHSFYLYSQTAGKYQRQPEAFKAAKDEEAAAEKLLKELPGELKKASDERSKAEEAAKAADAAAKGAAEALTTATRAAEQADAAVKEASEKKNAAKIAAEKEGATEELRKALTTAEKSLEAAAAAAKVASEAKLAAQKARDEKAAAAQQMAQTVATAKKSESDLTARVKAAEAQKTAAAAKLKELAPKDTTATFYSNVVTLKVLPPTTQPAK